MLRPSHQRRRQRVAVRVAVVPEDARRRHDQRRILEACVRVVHRRGGRVGGQGAHSHAELRGVGEAGESAVGDADGDAVDGRGLVGRRRPPEHAGDGIDRRAAGRARVEAVRERGPLRIGPGGGEPQQRTRIRGAIGKVIDGRRLVHADGVATLVTVVVAVQLEPRQVVDARVSADRELEGALG